MYRGIAYNLIGRLAVAGFPVILPVSTYWVYGQSAMLEMAHAFNLTSYVAVLALSGFVLPARDFRAEKSNPEMLSAYMRSYFWLTIVQVLLSIGALLCIWQLAHVLLQGIAEEEDFMLLFISLGLVQVVTIGTSAPTGFFIAHDKHMLPNVAAALCRAGAVIALLACGIAGLPLAVVGSVWVVIFVSYSLYLWFSVLQFRKGALISISGFPYWAEFLSILRRSLIYLIWAVLATAFLAAPLTYIGHRWPQEFGGMNYAFILGSSASAIVIAALIPKSNVIQDLAGDDRVVSRLLGSSFRLALLVFGVSGTCFLLSWPLHAVVVGSENVSPFRIAAPLVFLATSIRLATWTCTQCAIAIRAESIVMVGPFAEAGLALGLVWVLSQHLGPIGVPAGLVLAAAGRIVFMVVVEVPKLRIAWQRHRTVSSV